MTTKSTKPVEGVSLLIAGMANTGKTTLLKALDKEKTLVISVDGKPFDLNLPHASIPVIKTVYSLINEKEQFTGINHAIVRFKEVYGELPETIVIDTISRVTQYVNSACLEDYEGAEAYSEITKQINQLLQYIGLLQRKGINVITVTHVHPLDKGAGYGDTSFGAFKRNGGTISIHSNAIFAQIIGEEFMVSTRGAGIPARSTLSPEELPTLIKSSEYNLKDHIEMLKNKMADNSKLAL